MGAIAASDERRHRVGPDPLWAESWYFDFAAPDGTLGGYARLGLYPNLGVAWYWAALVGKGRRLVMVRDHEVELPRGRDLEVRGQGIWSAVNCETPLDHWSVGLEAFAVALDDPAEAYRGERGDRIGLGYDLEWEATAAADAPAGAPADAPAGGLESGLGSGLAGGLAGGWYWQPCSVTGEILVAEEKLAFEGTGCRAHRWGIEDWWSHRCQWASGVMGDGTAFSSPLDTLAAQAMVVEPLAPAPLLLVAPDGRASRLNRALCAFRGPGCDGFGWTDQLEPGTR